MRAISTICGGVALLDEGEGHDIGVTLHHALRDALAQPAQGAHFVLRERFRSSRFRRLTFVWLTRSPT